MARRRSVSSEESALFRDAVGPVRELPAAAAPARATPPAAEPRQRLADEAAAAAELRRAPFDAEPTDFGEPLEFLREGVQKAVLRRLKRGQYTVQDEFDLHGMNAATAEQALRELLRESLRAGRRCVRIVHGKGWGSADAEPVLKSLVDRLLRRRADVVAFASERPQHGGTGAVLVLLQAR